MTPETALLLRRLRKTITELHGARDLIDEGRVSLDSDEATKHAREVIEAQASALEQIVEQHDPEGFTAGLM